MDKERLDNLRKQWEGIGKILRDAEAKEVSENNQKYVGKYFKYVESEEGIKDYTDDYFHVTSVEVDTFYGDNITFTRDYVCINVNDMVNPISYDAIESNEEEYNMAKEKAKKIIDEIWLSLERNVMRNLKEDFLKDKESVNDYIEKNRGYIIDRGLQDFEELELFAWFLMNSHDTISSIACSCGHLSNSTYDAQTYIDDINEVQQTHYEGMIKEDLMNILKDSDLDDGEKILYITEYVEDLKDY